MFYPSMRNILYSTAERFAKIVKKHKTGYDVLFLNKTSYECSCYCAEYFIRMLKQHVHESQGNGGIGLERVLLSGVIHQFLSFIISGINSSKWLVFILICFSFHHLNSSLLIFAKYLILLQNDVDTVSSGSPS